MFRECHHGLTRCCTAEHTVMHWIYQWISHLLSAELIHRIQFDLATPLLSDCLLSLCLPLLDYSHTYTYMHHSAQRSPRHSGWLIIINIEVVEQPGFQLKAPFILPCLHLWIIVPPIFFCFRRRVVAAGSLNCPRKSVFSHYNYMTSEVNDI